MSNARTASTPAKILDVAVIGHTNTGKTSLLRTLTRRKDFGEVSARAATTRQVEMASLEVAERAAVRLYDTPGLEDSSSLLKHLQELKVSRQEDWLEALRAFCGDPELQDSFTQEAKALSQILRSHVILYVIDVRDPARAKHRDELEILGRCARPVLPLLNFVAEGDGQSDLWREQLARINMHAVIAFDTCVFDEAGELALYRKIASLTDRYAPLLEELIARLNDGRRSLKAQSSRLIAELLLELAAAKRQYHLGEGSAERAAMEDFRAAVRARERQALNELLSLHAYDPNDYLPGDLPFEKGAWQDDLFDPAALKRFGIASGTAAAAGASAGLAIDLMVGGITLGAAALAGAVAGLAIDGVRRYGGWAMDRLQGLADMRVSDETLMLVARRQIALLQALLRRGHGAQDPIEQQMPPAEALDLSAISHHLKDAQQHPDWSSLTDGDENQSHNSARNVWLAGLSDSITEIL